MSQSRTLSPSPVQLNFIEELPASSNVDCISLASILGDPMIKECWLFNYLFDMDFVMRHFDQDTRDIVQIRVVHGSWKREDPNGIHIEDAARRYPNIKVIKAYMPEMFGTHHTKAMVLFRHDDTAQVVILTANFIEQDFRMSQAIWKSSLLPLQKEIKSPSDVLPPLGSGPRFKHDLLAYFRGYSRNGTAPLRDLISQLQHYDFHAVRGALVGSLPGVQMPGQFEPEEQDRIGRWGLPALKRILSFIPTNSSPSSDPDAQPHIVAQVSSIASVGEKWLHSTLIPTLSTTAPTHKPNLNPNLKPKISIIFPTASEIRSSIDGYGSGSSIHIKTSSPAQAKQLASLKPMLCHWSSSHTTSHPPHHHHHHQSTGRSTAAPHVKTYIRFSSSTTATPTIDWALLTSANLSTQAWGTAPTATRQTRIASYELGILVWPALWADPHSPPCSTLMLPAFGTDMPPVPISPVVSSEYDKGSAPASENLSRVVAFRLPYDWPLTPYAEADMPWCAVEACDEVDWKGRVWNGFGRG
ncbi:tyrosyl-DNA phosphodiesterase I [Usnea florida]